MNRRSLRKVCVAVLLAIVALGGLPACNMLGQQQASAPTATLPPPTETPLPVLPTFTPTPTPLPPTATPVTWDPTLTPTVAPPAETPSAPPAVGGADTGASAPSETKGVSYVVKEVVVAGDAVVNGSFEDGFQDNGVGQGWTGFDNGGVAKYTWQEELQPIHVSHGEHAQLMQLTGAGEPNRYMGIYQTMDVMAGETYTLAIHGLIRSSDAGDSNRPYGHRIEWGIDYQGGQNWQAVGEWFDTGWNDIPLDKQDPTMNYISLPVLAESDKLTLFIRGWTKWPTQSIADFYVDGVFLKGPVGVEQTKEVVTTGGGAGTTTSMPTTGGAAAWVPIVGTLFVTGVALWEVRKASRKRSN
ncbi:MAG: hypothetical protein AB8I80_16895 [Anaerolineae bacterium]|jgi:hypothetical protein